MLDTDKDAEASEALLSLATEQINRRQHSYVVWLCLLVLGRVRTQCECREV